MPQRTCYAPYYASKKLVGMSGFCMVYKCLAGVSNYFITVCYTRIYAYCDNVHAQPIQMHCLALYIAMQILIQIGHTKLLVTSLS